MVHILEILSMNARMMIFLTDPGVLKTDDFVRRSVQCRTQQELLLNRIFSTDTLKSECI